MASAGPGLAVFGDLFIGSHSTETQGCAGLILGPAGNIIIDNTTVPPSVSIGLNFVSGATLEKYTAIPSTLSVLNLNNVPFNAVAISTAGVESIADVSPTVIGLPAAGAYYEVSWQAPVGSSATLELYVSAGMVNSTAAPAAIPGTQVTSGVANSQMAGYAILRAIQPSQISLRNNSGSSIILERLGGTDSTNATIVVRRLSL